MKMKINEAAHLMNWNSITYRPDHCKALRTCILKLKRDLKDRIQSPRSTNVVQRWAAFCLPGHPRPPAPHTFSTLGKSPPLSNVQASLLQHGDNDCTCLLGLSWGLNEWIYVTGWCLAQIVKEPFIFVISIITPTWYCVENYMVARRRCKESPGLGVQGAMFWSPPCHQLEDWGHVPFLFWLRHFDLWGQTEWGLSVPFQLWMLCCFSQPPFVR